MATGNPVLRWLGGLMAAAMTLVFVALGAGLFLLSRIDARAEISRLVEEATGRRLTINGAVGMTVWPVIGLEAADIALANVPGGRAPALATAKAVHIGVEIAPLFRQRLEVRNLVLTQPTLALEIDSAGAPNWALDLPAGTSAEISLRAITIEDGAASFHDARHDVSWAATDIDIATALTHLDAPMRLDGAIVYNRKPVALGIDIASPRALLEGRQTAVKGSARSDVLDAAFDGVASPGESGFAGKLSAAGPNLRALAAWCGTPIEGGAGLGPYKITGDISLEGTRLIYTKALFTLDHMSGSGYFELSSRRQKPFLITRLRMPELDLNPYLGGETNTPGATTEALRDTPLDFSGLSSFNGDLKLTTGKLRIRRMQIDRAVIWAQLLEGRLDAELRESDLYGGHAEGKLSVEIRNGAPVLSQDMRLRGVNVQPVLRDAVAFDAMEGRGDLALAVVMHGDTPRKMIRSADGALDLNVGAGAVRGVDLGGVSRTISNALNGSLIAPTARTPFTTLRGRFAIADGVMASNDLVFATPDLAIPGVGAIDLNDQSVLARLSPRSPRGGIATPFVVEGPLAALQYKSDLRGQRRDAIAARINALAGQASPAGGTVIAAATASQTAAAAAKP